MGGYISFSDASPFSNPSQLFCNISMLLKSFSEGKPSQCLLKSECWKIFNLLKWKYLLSSFLNGVFVLCTSVETFSDSSQWKYLLSSFLNGVYVLHQ
jgi:hypothetical protein